MVYSPTGSAGNKNLPDSSVHPFELKPAGFMRRHQGHAGQHSPQRVFHDPRDLCGVGLSISSSRAQEYSRDVGLQRVLSSEARGLIA